MSNPSDITGRIFGRLQIIAAGRRPAANRASHSYLIAACACGRIVRASRSNIVTGKTRSCGVCTKPNYEAQKFPRSTDGHAAIVRDSLQFSQTSVNL